MNIPPLLMRMKLIDRQHHVNLWIPLFLVWLTAVLLALALSPLILLLVLVLWPTGWGKFLWQFGPRFYSLLCALRDLEINIQGKNQVVLYFK
jgi:hypothetical protein